MLMTLREFIDRIRLGLEKKGFSSKSVLFHIQKLTEIYEKSPIFGELEINEFDDDYEEFCDGIKHLPVIDMVPAESRLFEILKKTHNEQVERRIHQLSNHYNDEQKKRKETWFPTEEEDIVDAINVRGIFGRTVLIEAALNGDSQEVNRLLGLGADYGIKDSSGNDALQVAIFNGHEDVADRLREEINKFPFR